MTPGDFLVADLSGPRQRFLGADVHGVWVVKATAADAKTFVDVDLAQAALAEWTGPIRRPFEWGHWKVYEIAALGSKRDNGCFRWSFCSNASERRPPCGVEFNLAAH